MQDIATNNEVNMLEYDKKRLEELEKALQIVNFITRLMQDDKIEEALPLIYLHYKDLPIFPKKVLTNNILEANKEASLGDKNCNVFDVLKIFFGTCEAAMFFMIGLSMLISSKFILKTKVSNNFLKKS